MRAVLVLAIAATLLAAVSASGQVPAKMNYQVMLTNNSDEPLADEAVTLVFRIYNSDIGGVMLWNETHATTTNSIGVVSAVLGTTTPFSPTLFHQPLWVEVEVDGETLTPRRELVSAPYALHASDSDKLGMIVASEYALREDLFVPGVINTPSNPVDWTMLKNVPAGFADGADDTGGAGDGHSLDADDGSPVDAVYVNSEGVLEFGSSVSDGVAEFFASGSASPSIGLYAFPVHGGQIELYEESGALYGALEPDFDGTGGFLWISDGTGFGGFYVDGNVVSGGAQVGICGMASHTYFNTYHTGDQSVDLPVDAVSSPEIFDEPGVAHSSEYAGLLLSGDPCAILSASIAVPGPGYVLAFATAEAEATRSAGQVGANFGISEYFESYSQNESRVYHGEHDGTSVGHWYPGVSVHTIFEAFGAGTHTYYFLADEVFGDWMVYDRVLTLVYIPTAYGTVSRVSSTSTAGPEGLPTGAGRPLSEADVAAERAESVAFNNARIERELAEMEAKIAEIRASMGNGNKR